MGFRRWGWGRPELNGGQGLAKGADPKLGFDPSRAASRKPSAHGEVHRPAPGPRGENAFVYLT